MATGAGADQLRQAAEYYLQVKAANPNVTVTFTGHSLGGGLAALMGVFFGKQAVTFDQAPFANSAELSLIPPDVAANLRSYLVVT
ncbi:MAG: lipase family protein [Nitrospira sp.]